MTYYFWTREEKPAHIIEKVEPAENPCGNDSQSYVANCGELGNAWTMNGLSGHIFASDEDMEKFKRPVCPICLEIENIKAEVALKYGRKEP